MFNKSLSIILLAGVLFGFSSMASAQVRCDFDDDDLSELAIGVPGDADGVGAVYVVDYNGNLLLPQGRWFRPGQNVDSFGAAVGTFFGSALACGDFNGDGFDDLAIGAPGTMNNQGSVSLLYGSPLGLQAPAWDGRLYQNMPDLNETMEDGDHFGAALIAGDFNDDGVDDLAIGVPGESAPGGVVTAWPEQGLVHVLYGTTEEEASPDFPPGISPLGSQQFHPNQAGVEIFGEATYGTSLAAADLDGDGVDDLAIGAPGGIEVEGDPILDLWEQSGKVHVLKGVSGALAVGGGLDLTTTLILSKTDMAPDFQFDAYFGFSLATGNFDGQGGHELAVGAPLETLGDNFVEVNSGYGAVTIYEFDAVGGIADMDFWFETKILGDGHENRDRFGFALTAADFDGSGEDDLVISHVGETYEYLGEEFNAGAVTILYGGPTGLIEAPGNQRTIVNLVLRSQRFMGFGFALSAGSFLAPDEVNLVVGISGWDGENEQGESVSNAGALAVFRGLIGVGVASGSPSGFLHKDMIEPDANWKAAASDLLQLYPGMYVTLSGRGERFGSALGR